MSGGLILGVHVAGAEPSRIGDEIWEQSHDEAIRFEASIVAQDAGCELLESPSPKHRDELRDQVIAEMTAALTQPGDSYQAPDGVRYSLTRDAPGEAQRARSAW